VFFWCSSLVIETLCRQSGGKRVAVACLYCDFHAHNEQSTAHMLGAILKQVASGLERIPQEIEAAFQGSKSQLDGRELETGAIVKLLISTLGILKRSYICVGGLGEFPQAHRPEFFKSLVQVIQESPGTRLFLTGRPHIEEEMELYFTSMKVPIKPTEEDIQNYLTMRLSNDTQPRVMSPDLREEILRTIPKKISDMYVQIS